MNATYTAKIAHELKIQEPQVEATADLLADDCTVPFIARYRKEATGNLDEVAIFGIRDRLGQLKRLDERRQTILKSIEEQDKLTPELKAEIEAADTLAALEDLYMPYRPKRRTRASDAREKGLEPLADILWAQDDRDPAAEAQAFVDEEKGVASVEDALAGARDILAERINENRAARGAMRELFFKKGEFRSKVLPGKEEEGKKFRDYFDWHERVSKAPSHRILAVRRGEKEGIVSLHVAPDEDEAVGQIEQMFIEGDSPAAAHIKEAVHSCYRRLLRPAMETEVRQVTKERADAEAIRVFSANLRELLLSPPLGEKRVLAIDPGFRSGCKVALLDAQGKLVDHGIIYPHKPRNRTEESGQIIRELCQKYETEAIAIGNGSGGRETEVFIRALGLPKELAIVMVDESGASVYSASKAARREFPKLDVATRGAVSIGRRLQDPLAELVKIDPKAIGVGQYQHDVDQNALRKGLDDTVVSCVNLVGVEVNTASRQLLRYVSGIGPSLASNIVRHREENGPFKSRQALLEVNRLGPKAFQQAAGFLRIRDAENPLDASAVHPESYPIVERMAADQNASVQALMKDPLRRDNIELEKYATDTVGMPTLKDILAELVKPGRDPRKEFTVFRFAEGITSIEDLEVGSVLPGQVTNVTRFGAFIDVGVHQDGLVHVSEMADRFVKDPTNLVKVHQPVQVRVLEVDVERKRISLSMRTKPRPERARKKPSGKRSEETPREEKKQPSKPTVTRRPQGGPADDRKGGGGKRGGGGKGRPRRPQSDRRGGRREAPKPQAPKEPEKPFNLPFKRLLADIEPDEADEPGKADKPDAPDQADSDES